MDLQEITKDAAATLAGYLVAAAVGAALAYQKGAVTKEDLCAAAIIAVGGHFAYRGNKTPMLEKKGKESDEMS